MTIRKLLFGFLCISSIGLFEQPAQAMEGTLAGTLLSASAQGLYNYGLPAVSWTGRALWNHKKKVIAVGAIGTSGYLLKRWLLDKKLDIIDGKVDRVDRKLDDYSGKIMNLLAALSTRCDAGFRALATEFREGFINVYKRLDVFQAGHDKLLLGQEQLKTGQGQLQLGQDQLGHAQVLLAEDVQAIKDHLIQMASEVAVVDKKLQVCLNNDDQVIARQKQLLRRQKRAAANQKLIAQRSGSLPDGYESDSDSDIEEARPRSFSPAVLAAAPVASSIATTSSSARAAYAPGASVGGSAAGMGLLTRAGGLSSASPRPALKGAAVAPAVLAVRSDSSPASSDVD